jgi:hypothetical protein
MESPDDLIVPEFGGLLKILITLEFSGFGLPDFE